MGVGKLRFKTVYLHNLNYHAVKRYVVLNYKLQRYKRINLLHIYSDPFSATTTTGKPSGSGPSPLRVYVAISRER